jgi:peroxiredoxin
MRSIGQWNVLAIALALALSLAVLVSVQAIAIKGRKAPDFKLISIDGKKISLSDLSKPIDKKHPSSVVLLDFWATWCPPCREEIPHLQKLHEKYAKDGLSVVGIAGDSDSKAMVRSFAKAKKLTYAILLDTSADAHRTYGIRGYPTVYLIDRKGIIHGIHIGYVRGMEKDIEAEVKSLLK